jgi:hypothetical protein
MMKVRTENSLSVCAAFEKREVLRLGYPFACERICGAQDDKLLKNWRSGRRFVKKLPARGQASCTRLKGRLTLYGSAPDCKVKLQVPRFCW